MRNSWELQDEQIESGSARDGPIDTLIGRDEGDRVLRKLRVIGDQSAAGNHQVLPTAIGWLLAFYAARFGHPRA